MTDGRAPPYANLDEYGLRHLAGHLFRLGHSYHKKLFQLATKRDWHDAQRRFDPSRQSYAESLEWALRAATGERPNLQVLLMVSVLRATVGSLALGIPPAALEVLALLGRTRQAHAYTSLQADALARCESLCRLATAVGREGVARDHLQEAIEVARSVGGHRPRAHAFCLVAEASGQSGINDLAREAFFSLQALLAKKNWAVATAARDYGLLDKPPYILALVSWDRTRGTVLRDLQNSALPVLAKTACQEGDRALLGRILAEIENDYFSRVPVLEALTEAGCAEEAFQLLAAWSGHLDQGGGVVLREAIARAAGRLGDLAVLERAASYLPAREASLGERRPPALDWDDRLEAWKDRLGDSFERALKGLGSRVLGTDWDQMVVLLAGLESLAEHHPEHARRLWSRLKKQGNRLARRLAQEVPAFIPAVSGGEPPSLLPRYLNMVARLAALSSNPRDQAERNETMALLAEVRANLGEISRAREHLTRIEDPGERDSALLAISDQACSTGQLDLALEMAGQIGQGERRKHALNKIALALSHLSPAQVEAPLMRLFALADCLPAEEMMGAGDVAARLLGSLAENQPCRAAYASGQALASSPSLAVLVILSKFASKQQDLDMAHTLTEAAAKRLAEPAAVRPQAVNQGRAQLAENPHLRRGAQLADMAVHWAQAAGRTKRAAQDEAWLALSEQAYELARGQFASLPRIEVKHLPYLARAARFRRDRVALRKLLKLASGQFELRKNSVDRALVHIAVGLTLTGDYLDPGKDQYPPAVAAIYWDHFKAQALAEMAEVVRATPEKKGLFGRRRDRMALDIRAEALLEQSKKLLGLRTAKLKSPLGIQLPFSRTGISPLGLQSKLPPKSGMQSFLVPTKEALCGLITVYVRRGLYQEAAQIPGKLAAEADRPAVLGLAVKLLAEAGQIAQAEHLLGEALIGPEKTTARFSLAEAQASRDPNRAKRLLEEGLAALWDHDDRQEALAAYAGALSRLPEEARLSYFNALLAGARARGRGETLQVLASHVRALAVLFDPPQWQETVRMMLATDNWWSPEG